MSKLKRMMIRYFPPGLVIEKEENGKLVSLELELFDLNAEADIEVVANRIIHEEKAIKMNKKHALLGCLKSVF